MTADIEYNNQQMNKPIYSWFPIDEYFEQINDYMHFADDGKTPYTSAQVIHKSLHMLLESVIYIDACKEWSNKPAVEQNGLYSRMSLKMSTMTSISLRSRVQ